MRGWRTAAAVASWLVASAAITAAQQRTLPELFTEGAETLWVVELDGERIGHVWSRYEGVAALAEIRAHRFSEQVMLEAPVAGGRLVQKFTDELWTDARGRPLRIVFRAEMSDVRAAIDATFAEGKVEAHVRQGPTDRRQEVDIAQNAFVLGNNFVGHLDLALAIEAPPRDRKTSLTFFSINALRDLPYTLEPVAGPAASDGAVFRDSLGEILHLDRNGRLERVEMPAQKVVFRRADEPVERFVIEAPQAAAPAGDLDREEVRIEHGEVSLAGTITRPLGATGPFPTVFFVSGSGGQDRNGVSSGIDVGTHEILDRLTREGFLMLRVDDRGTGESRGPTAALTFDDLVEDARACVRFLQERSDVDRSRIAVIGHSEGGLTATILAAEMELAAVVLMAAPGRGLRDLMREQLARGRKLSGAGAEELADLDRAVAAFFEQVDAGEPFDGDALPPELRPFVDARPWLRSHATQDPVASLKRVRAPVLLLQGARDIQVSLERDAQRLLRALDEIGHPDHELIVFPELDHLFKRTLGEQSSGLDYLKTRPIDPGFLDTLASWLRDHLAGNARDA